MRKLAALALGLVLGLPGLAAATCTLTTGPLTLEKPRVGDSGLVWAGCLNRNFDILSSSGVIGGSTAPVFLREIHVSTIGAWNASGIYVASPTVFASSSTFWYPATFVGSATFGAAVGFANGYPVTGSIVFASSLTLRGAVGFESSINLTAGQAINGAATFKSSVTIGTLGVTSALGVGASASVVPSTASIYASLGIVAGSSITAMNGVFIARGEGASYRIYRSTYPDQYPAYQIGFDNLQGGSHYWNSTIMAQFSAGGWSATDNGVPSNLVISQGQMTYDVSPPTTQGNIISWTRVFTTGPAADPFFRASGQLVAAVTATFGSSVTMRGSGASVFSLGLSSGMSLADGGIRFPDGSYQYSAVSSNFSTMTAHAAYVLNNLTVGSSLTVRSPSGTNGSLFTTAADDFPLTWCNRTRSASCALYSAMLISNAGVASWYHEGETIMAHAYPNTYFNSSGLKFGIGTTAPLAKLHVSGDTALVGAATTVGSHTVTGNLGSGGFVTAAGWFKSNNTETNTPGTHLYTGSGEYWGIRQGTDHYPKFDIYTTNWQTPLSFAANGGDFYIQLSTGISGRVGIGTASPASKLHVEGSAAITGGPLTVSGGSLTVTSAGLRIDSDIAAGLKAYSGSDFEFLFGASPSDFAGLGYSTALDIAYLQTNSLPAGGGLTVADNGSVGVGVGLSAHGSKFHVQGGSITSQGAGAGIRVWKSDASDNLPVAGFYRGALTNTNYYDGFMTGAGLGTGDNNLSIYSVAGEGSHIQSINYLSAFADIHFQKGGGAVTFYGASVFNEDSADKDFRVEGDSDAALIFADASADKVGIGTASPGAKLDVRGSATINDDALDADFRVEGTSDQNLIRTAAASNVVGIGGYPSGSYKLEVTGAEYVSGNSLVNGSLGLGTASPLAKLSVVGDSSFSLPATFQSSVTLGGSLGVPVGIVSSVTVYGVIGSTGPSAHPSARYTRTSALTLANDSNTVIKFNIKEYDSRAMFDVTTATVPAGGEGSYDVRCFAAFANDGSPSNRRNITVLKNGSALTGCSDSKEAVTGDETRVNVACAPYLVAGDAIECQAYQNDGGNLDINSASIEVRKAIY